MVADMAADLEEHMVADMEVDKVAVNLSARNVWDKFIIGNGFENQIEVRGNVCKPRVMKKEKMICFSFSRNCGQLEDKLEIVTWI